MDALGPTPPTPPSLPFHLHKAYGTPAPGRSTPTTNPAPTTSPQRTITLRPVGGASPTEPIAIARPADRLDRTDSTTLASAAQAKARTARIASLVAARVETPAVETGFPRPAEAVAVAQPRATGGKAMADSLPFYRHPSEAHRVATEIAIGRSLDAKG